LASSPLEEADAERQLHELGSRPQPADTARALTPRERQVAELAAAGHSNRQISGELGVATKTVEATLTRALAKLGATSRTQVATRLKQAHGSRS
jgi:DNA-binding NarL/FixJ family response regulator